MAEHILNSTCNNGEQIVSFLYGELSDKEKTDFERHLQVCDNCADELGEFSNVHFSLAEWRTEDFQHLSTPIFVMPPSQSVTEAANSWYETFRRFFALHSAGFSAAAATVLLAFVGFFWFFNNSTANNEIVSNRTTNISGNDVSLKPEKDLIGKNLNSTDKNDSETVEFSGESQSRIVKDVQPETTAVKTKVSNSLKNEKSKQSNRKKLAPIKPESGIEKPAPKNKNIENIPTLAIEDYEDNSLRLSEIFEEVSMK